MVFTVLSHALTFSMLFVASLFDLDTTDVPDAFCATAVLGGIGLHALASMPFQIGVLTQFLSTNGLLSVFSYRGLAAVIASLGEPLTYSLLTGLFFSVLGWGAYLRGMWGGADAFAMSALGFGAPFAGVASLLGPVNLFINISLVGFVYVMSFTLYKSFQNPEVWEKTRERVLNEKKRIGLEFAGAIVISVLLYAMNAPAFVFGVLFVFMILLSRFLEEVQEKAFYRTVGVEDLEPGDVAAPGQGFGDRIVGLTQEDIEEIDGEEFEIREGVPFMPVFVIALVVTDVFGAGLFLFSSLF